MKKLLAMLLLCATVFNVSSCSKEDDAEAIKLTQDIIVGTWNVVWAEQNGSELEIPEGYIYMILRSDGSYRTVMFRDSYSGTYHIEGSTVVGTTLDPITEYYKFTYLQGDYAEIDYSNSVGDQMKFKVNKQ